MMFDHLDDPEGFVPDDRLRTGVLAAARRRRRRRRLAGAGGGLALVLVVAAVGAAALVRDDLDRIERVEVTGLAGEPGAGEPYVVLLVGVDAREGSSAPDGGPEAGGSRTDTMVLALVDPSTRQVTALPLPRDLWVDLPGHGPGRLNQAYALGGRSLLVETVRRAFGIEVSHYLEVGFDGVRRIGDEVGGLHLAFDGPVRDRSTGLDAAAGCRAYDGTALLALARARHLERHDGAGWRPDPTGDLGRIERQQAIGLALLDALGRLDRSDPRDLARLLDAVAPHLTLDGGTSDGDLLALARGILGSQVRSARLPVGRTEVEGASVLVEGPGADAVLAPLREAAPAGDRPGLSPHGAPGPEPGDQVSGTGAVVPRPC